jgi:hypothetical protein
MMSQRTIHIAFGYNKINKPECYGYQGGKTGNLMAAIFIDGPKFKNVVEGQGKYKCIVD